MLTLKNASYSGGFGYSPRCTTLSSTSAGIDMGNWGAHLFCAAIGDWITYIQPQHIEYGTISKDTDFDVSFPNGAFEVVPKVFVSLAEDTYTGQIGGTPSVVKVTRQNATIRPNNTGMRVHWVAIGHGTPNAERIKI